MDGLDNIYNSRNYSILLNEEITTTVAGIYNSRNYSILLNTQTAESIEESTTVEIILYYLTVLQRRLHGHASTTVEIILYYLTVTEVIEMTNLQQ